MPTEVIEEEFRVGANGAAGTVAIITFNCDVTGLIPAPL